MGEVEEVEEVEAPQDRSSAATTTDIFAIGDMYLSGYSTKCGAQTITGWTSSLDIYYSKTATTDSTSTYVSTGSGTYTAPEAGYYNICAFLRFKKGGNAVDVTVYAGGSVVAGFGDAVDGDWSRAQYPDRRFCFRRRRRSEATSFSQRHRCSVVQPDRPTVHSLLHRPQ